MTFTWCLGKTDLSVYLCHSKVKGTKNQIDWGKSCMRSCETDNFFRSWLRKGLNGGLQLHTRLSLRRKRQSDGYQLKSEHSWAIFFNAHQMKDTVHYLCLNYGVLSWKMPKIDSYFDIYIFSILCSIIIRSSLGVEPKIVSRNVSQILQCCDCPLKTAMLTTVLHFCSKQHH